MTEAQIRLGRLARLGESKYAYRRLYESTFRTLTEEEVEAIYRKHFPHDAERNEENALLALDVEYSTEYFGGKPGIPPKQP